MEPLFKNITKYNNKNYHQFLEFHSHKNTFSYNFYTIIMTLLLVYCIILNFAQKNINFILLFIALLVGFLLVRIYLPVRRYKKDKKQFQNSKEVSHEFCFYKRHFTLNKQIFYYFKLYKVYETAEYFYLYINEDHAALVSKNGFSIGTAEDFTEFIKKKCLLKYSKQA